MNVRGAVVALVGLLLVAEACSSATTPEQIGTSSSRVTFGSTWVPIGATIITDAQTSSRGQATGRVSVIAANPQNPNLDVWVGGASGGLWHGTRTSISSAFTWTSMLDSLSPQSIGAIKLKDCTTTRCATVWVGTGENAIRRDTYYGSGVVEGRWNGSAYTFSTGLGGSTFANGAITALAVVPNGTYPSETVYVALSSGTATSATNGTIETAPAGTYGIYKSTNSGSTWSLVLSQTGKKPTDLAMDPTNSSILYAALQSAGYYTSTNSGSTWKAINSGINSALLTGGATPADWASIAIAPSAHTTLYAAIAQCPSGFTPVENTYFCSPAIYASTNSGKNWTQKVAFNTDPTLTSYFAYTHKIAVHPTNASELWFTGLGLSHSTNSGGTWSGIGLGGDGTHGDHHDFVPYLDGSVLRAYDANDGGFYAGHCSGSTWDNTETWEDGVQYGLQVTQLQSLAALPTVPNVVMIGTQDNGSNILDLGVWAHVDDGDASSTIIDADDDFVSYDVPTDQGPRISPPTWRGRRCKSMFLCNYTAWDQIAKNPDIDVTEGVAFYPPMIQGGILPNQSGGTSNHCLFLGQASIYVSCDKGATWPRVAISNLLPHQTSFPYINTVNPITAMAFAPSNPQTLYVGYYDGEVWMISGMDFGNINNASATRIRDGSSANPVSAIAVSSVTDGIVWVAYTGTTSGSIVVSSNYGQSWSDFSAGLPATHVNALAYMFGTNPSGDYLFVGTDTGVYERGPADPQLHVLASGIPAVPVLAFAYDDASNPTKLYAGTHGRGVWALNLTTTPLISDHHFWCETCQFFGPGPVAGPVVLPLVGQMLPPSQSSCTVTLYQQAVGGGLVQCASGTTDGDGATIQTDTNGNLVATKSGVYTNKRLVWGCFGGKCAGDTGQSQCMSAPVVQATVTCGGTSGTVQITQPPVRLGAPSAYFTLSPDTNVAHPAYTLTLNARYRDSTGTPQTLCSVAQTFTPGTTADQIVTTLGQAVNASSTCARVGVAANVSTSTMGGGGGEDDDGARSAISLSAPNLSARQLFPEIQGATYGLLKVDSMGLLASQETESPMVTITLPPDGRGAAGGSLTITETGSLGRCSYSITTHAGDTATTIANNAAASFNSASDDSTCHDLEKARDLLIANAGATSANALFAAARSVSVQSSDPNVTITIGPAGW